MAKKKEEKQHALLSASGAKKWLNCPASARLEENIPDEESEYAKEGTLAHSMCELKLEKLFTDRNMTDRTYKSRLNKLQKDPLYQKEMDGYTDRYADYMMEVANSFNAAPTVAVEKRLDYSDWAPEGFGTGDCILISGTELHVIDFKYGKGVAVSAEDNPQMKCYGLGAIKDFAFIYPIATVTLHIVQPRINNFSKWSITRAELETWGLNVLKPAAEKAFAGGGECVPGSWCDEGFCKLRGTCRARTDKYMAFMDTAVSPNPTGTTVMNLPPALSNGEVGKILKEAQFLAAWVKKLEEFAQKEILAGREIPGWKLVEGRSNRAISDQIQAFEALKAAGYEDAVLYETVPLTLTKLEAVITKEHKDSILNKYITKPQGKPTLAPADDKRPAMQMQVTAEEAFGGANTYKEDK
ncbi:MAG: DUF2800 domain-containing protein [Lachnospiraceae bacterium]|nr:DUF2800 domain-containing protein [Lachnospiraceae bacterium]